MFIKASEINKHHILDSEPQEKFNKLTKLAVKICNCEISFISLFDERQDKQWFKSLEGIDILEFPLSQSLCQYLHIEDEPYLYFSDISENQEFRNNPAAIEFGLKSYAGFPLISDGKIIGSFCVCGYQPNELDEGQLEFLRTMAEHTMILVEYHKLNTNLLKQTNMLEKRRLVTEKASKVGKMGGFYVNFAENDIFWASSNNSLFDLDERYSMTFSEFRNAEFIGNEQFVSIFSKLRGLLLDSENGFSNFSFELENSNKLIQINGEICDGELLVSFHDHTIQHDLNYELRTYKVIMEQVEEMVDLGGWAYNVITKEIIFTKNSYAIYELPLESVITVEVALSHFEKQHELLITADFENLICSGTKFKREYLFKSSSGKLKWVKASGHPVYSKGRLIRVVGSLQDITNDKLLIEKLKESESKAVEQSNYYKSLINSHSFYVCKLNASGQILFCNDLYLQKFTDTKKLSDSLGEYFFKNMSSDFSYGSLENLSKISLGKILNHSIVLSQKIPDGQIVKIHWDFTGHIGDDGKVSDILCLGYDISELEESKARVEYLADYSSIQDLKISSYNAIISHNIRSHVANSLGLLNLMDSENEGEDFNNFFNLLKNEVRKLDNTILTLDAITSKRNSRDQIEESFNLYILIEDVFGVFENMYPNVAINKINEISSSIEIFLSRKRLNEIVLQLLIYCFEKIGIHRQVSLQLLSKSITDNIVKITIVFSFDNSELVNEDITEFRKLNSSVDSSFYKEINLKFIEKQIDAFGGKLNIISNDGAEIKIVLELTNNGY